MSEASFNAQAAAKALHQQPNNAKLVLYVTGGGSQAIGDLLSVPGASNTILEATVPYSKAASDELLGGEPEKYCSEETSLRLARGAFRRAAALTHIGTRVLGFAVTAGLATVREKQGEHQAFLACEGGDVSTVCSICFSKGLRSREQEERLLADAVVHFVAQHAQRGSPAAADALQPAATNASQPDPAGAGGGPAGEETGQGLWGPEVVGADEVFPGVPGFGEGDSVRCRRREVRDALRELLEGRVRCVELTGDVEARRTVMDAPRRGMVMLSGSFNPLHIGHRRLLKVAEQEMQRPGVFELSAENSDKGTIDIGELRRRLQVFHESGLPVVVTRAPLFKHKAGLFPNTTFVLGYDTAQRVVNPKYYHTDDGTDARVNMIKELERISQSGCNVLVGGRSEDNTFRTLKDLGLEKEVSDVLEFRMVPESRFREDISSTEIRARLASASLDGNGAGTGDGRPPASKADADGETGTPDNGKLSDGATLAQPYTTLRS